MRRDAEGLLERSREVRGGDMAYARQPMHGPGLVRGGIHPILRAQQAAQELRVLACRIFFRVGLPTHDVEQVFLRRLSEQRAHRRPRSGYSSCTKACMIRARTPF